MNTVKRKPKADGPEHTTVGALIGENIHRHKYTAFIGKCGLDGPENSLYLISFSGIVLASFPSDTWFNYTCGVTINYYCDITITEDEK